MSSIINNNVQKFVLAIFQGAGRCQICFARKKQTILNTMKMHYAHASSV